MVYNISTINTEIENKCLNIKTKKYLPIQTLGPSPNGRNVPLIGTKGGANLSGLNSLGSEK
jgi:hypothetical protein